MNTSKRRVEGGVSSWVVAACVFAAAGCAGAERDFGDNAGNLTADAGDASTVGEEAGVVVPEDAGGEGPTSSPTASTDSTQPDSSEPPATSDTGGGSGASSGDTGDVDTGLSDTGDVDTGLTDTGLTDTGLTDTSGGGTDLSTGVTSETDGTSGGDTGYSGDDPYYEDSGYAYSCVELCKGTYYGDTSLTSSKVGGLHIAIPPQSGCSYDCASQVVEISAGAEHTCARRGDGSVKCWGNGLDGRLGLGDILWHGSGPNEMGDALAMVDLGYNRKARQVSAGHDHTCAVLEDWSVKCWGANGEGQLGQGDTQTRGDEPGEMGDYLSVVDLGVYRTARSVSAGHRDTCVVLDNGGVKCWGQDELGKLGQGNSGSLGDEPGEMGDYLSIIDLGRDEYAVSVEATYQHTCALLESGFIKCWGYQNAGRLGMEGNDASGDDLAEMGDALPVVDLGYNRHGASLGLGYLHSCAVLNDNGALKCWGYGQGGRLGLGDNESRGVSADQMGDALQEIALGHDAAVRLVAPGDEHTCALLTNGAVKCWGVASLGRLGSGDAYDRGDERGEMGDELSRVDLGTERVARALASGYRHSCALLDDGSVKCWGEGDTGRLGLGDQEDRGDQPGEMGDALPAVFLW